LLAFDPDLSMTKTILITALIAIMTLSLTLFFVGSSADAVKMDGAKVASGTIQSMQDPGVGHETHQLAIILPPSDQVYKGTLSYSASEPIQLVALHGPLGPGDVQGQAIWTPDGKTKFAMTFIDPQTSMGSWVFTGNALAVHTLHSDQFTVSYSVKYYESEMSDTVTTATLESMQDPGVGHETHQLAIILPPSENTYHGVLTYSASEPIQLVALLGPLERGDDKGQAVWTPDGKTKFGLTFVDPETSMGTWSFSGNALAVHTMNPDQFTVSYSVSAKETALAEMMEEEMMMEEEIMEEEILRPLQQMKAGVDPKDVVCKEGLLLILRSSDGSAACVTESSSTKLIDMGFGTLG